MMTFKQLEALYWIGQLGGFAPAARKLHTTQSAISKRVHELEQIFDTALFDRSQRSARLTEKGEEMFMLARKLLRERDAAVEQFGRPEVIERRLRIGVTELTAMTWLPRLVALVREHYPKVTLEPDVDGSLPLRDKLQVDALDLIIVPDAFADSRLPAKPVGQVESAWMCRPGLVQPPAPAARAPARSGRPPPAGAGQRIRHRPHLRRLDARTRRGARRHAGGQQPHRPGRPHHLRPGRELPAPPLPRPLVAAGMLAEIEVQPPLPPVPYVAMVRADQRSALVGSVIMLAQSCCDFTRVFQAGAAPAPCDAGPWRAGPSAALAHQSLQMGETGRFSELRQLPYRPVHAQVPSATSCRITELASRRVSCAGIDRWNAWCSACTYTARAASSSTPAADTPRPRRAATAR